MGVLNDYVRHLTTLKDNSKAVPMKKKGKVPFGEADLAAILLPSVPMTWQNQYNLTHLTVFKSRCALLPDLEAIKQVMVEKKNRRLQAKVRLPQPGLRPRAIPSKRCLGAQLVKSLRRVAVKGFASVAKPTAVPNRPTTPWTTLL
jgi:hypothetical protein